MFDISFLEILIISMVALIVVGPERLPQVARTLGHLFGRCRTFVYGIKTDIHNEIRMEELKEMQHSIQEKAQSIENEFRQEVDQLKSTADMTPLEKGVAETQDRVKTPVDQTQKPLADQQQASEAGESVPSNSEKGHK